MRKTKSEMLYDESVKEMCNVSEGLVNRCLAKGMEQGVATKLVN